MIEWEVGIWAALVEDLDSDYFLFVHKNERK